MRTEALVKETTVRRRSSGTEFTVNAGIVSPGVWGGVGGLINGWPPGVFEPCETRQNCIYPFPVRANGSYSQNIGDTSRPEKYPPNLKLNL